MIACCDRMRHLPGGPMCPAHGITGQPPKPAAPKTPSGRPRWASQNRFHDGLTRQQSDDAMATGLLRALNLIRHRLNT